MCVCVHVIYVCYYMCYDVGRKHGFERNLILNPLSTCYVDGWFGGGCGNNRDQLKFTLDEQSIHFDCGFGRSGHLLA